MDNYQLPDGRRLCVAEKTRIFIELMEDGDGFASIAERLAAVAPMPRLGRGEGWLYDMAEQRAKFYLADRLDDYFMRLPKNDPSGYGAVTPDNALEKLVDFGVLLDTLKEVLDEYNLGDDELEAWREEVYSWAD